MNIALIVICSIVFIAAGQPEWLASGPLALRMASYHFFHAGILHLAVNSLALSTVFSSRHNDNLRCLFAGYAIATLCYPLSSAPCIGMSNMIYAVIGMRTPPFSSAWWRTAPVITFMAVTAAMLFVPGISGLTHIVSFASGIACAYFARLWRS